MVDCMSPLCGPAPVAVMSGLLSTPMQEGTLAGDRPTAAVWRPLLKVAVPTLLRGAAAGALAPQKLETALLEAGPSVLGGLEAGQPSTDKLGRHLAQRRMARLRAGSLVPRGGGSVHVGDAVGLTWQPGFQF